MFVKPFRYERAEDVLGACELLREHGEVSKVLAGGQSLLPMMNVGIVEADVLVDISHVPDMAGIVRSEGYLEIGSLTRHAALVSDPDVRTHQPLLSEAARWVGNRRIRNRGTLGGTLAHADPAAEIPLVLTALGAVVEVTDGRTVRDVKADELSLSYLTTQLEPDEVVTGARVPVLGPDWGWSFFELARRSGDFAIVAVAVLVRCADGHALEARVAAAGVGDRPVRLGEVEASLSDATRNEAADRLLSVRVVDSFTDQVASAAYRRHLLSVLVRRAVDEAFSRSELQ